MERAGPRTTGIPSGAQRSASQVPDAQAFDRDDTVGPRGGNGPQKRLRAGLQVSRPQALAVLVEDADRHGPGVPVEATVKLLWRGVEAPEVSSA
jgi:hypothetical protein